MENNKLSPKNVNLFQNCELDLEMDFDTVINVRVEDMKEDNPKVLVYEKKKHVRDTDKLF